MLQRRSKPRKLTCGLARFSGLLISQLNEVWLASSFRDSFINARATAGST